jgi:hypothetical protein
MLKSALNSPYKNGRPFYTAKKSGVYLIFRNATLRYVGYSGYNVYKTLYRHFQSWNDPNQIRSVYSPTDQQIKVRVIYCNNSKAKKLENALIIKYQPIDNPDKLSNLIIDKNEKKVLIELDDEFVTFNGDLPF